MKLPQTMHDDQPLSLPLPGRRTLDANSGRALVHLAHAIEYLIDEANLAHCDLRLRSEHIEAAERLMALNRAIYFACPLALSFRQRVLALLGGRAA